MQQGVLYEGGSGEEDEEFDDVDAEEEEVVDAEVLEFEVSGFGEMIWGVRCLLARPRVQCGLIVERIDHFLESCTTWTPDFYLSIHL